MTISIPPGSVNGEFDLIFSQRTADGGQLAMVGKFARLRDSGRVGTVDLPAPRP